MKKAKNKPEGTRKRLLYDINKFLAANPEISEEHFGWLAIKDNSLVARLKVGKDITTRKLDLILAFLNPQPKGNPHD